MERKSHAVEENAPAVGEKSRGWGFLWQPYTVSSFPCTYDGEGEAEKTL